MSRGPGVKECGAAPWRGAGRGRRRRALCDVCGAGRVRPAGRLLRRQDPTRTRLSWLGAVSSGAGADARSLDAGGPRQ
jgi:hypothetical protein